MTYNPFITVYNKIGQKYGKRDVDIKKNNDSNAYISVKQGAFESLPVGPDRDPVCVVELEAVEISTATAAGKKRPTPQLPSEAIPISIQSPENINFILSQAPESNKWILEFEKPDDVIKPSDKKVSKGLEDPNSPRPVTVTIGTDEPHIINPLLFKVILAVTGIVLPLTWLCSRVALNVSEKVWTVIPILFAGVSGAVWLIDKLKEKKNNQKL